MKAALLLGAILLISLVMAKDPNNKPTNAPESGTKESPSTTKSTGTMVSGGPVFFLLPLMWMVVHLLHM